MFRLEFDKMSDEGHKLEPNHMAVNKLINFYNKKLQQELI